MVGAELTDNGAADNWRELDEWVAKLELSGAGRLLLTNFKFDCLLRRPSREILLELLNEMRKALSLKRGLLDGLKSEDVATLVIGELQQIIAQRRADYYLKNDGEVATADQWARVMRGGQFVGIHVKPGRIAYVDEGVPTVEEIRAAVRNPGWSTNKTVCRQGSCAWVTPLNDILDRVDLRREPPEFTTGDAATIRSTLGLTHYKSGEVVVVVIYPNGDGDVTPAMAPTVVEGGCNPVYRSDKSGDGWGYAVDLETWNRGGREAVHGPVRLTEQFEPIVIATLLDDVSIIEHDKLLEDREITWKPGVDTVADLVRTLLS